MSGIDWKLDYRKQDPVKLGSLFKVVSASLVNSSTVIAYLCE